MSSTRYSFPENDQEPADLSGSANNTTDNGGNPSTIDASSIHDDPNNRAIYPPGYPTSAAPHQFTPSNVIHNGASAYTFNTPNFPNNYGSLVSVSSGYASHTVSTLHAPNNNACNSTYQGFDGFGFGRGAAEQSAHSLVHQPYLTNHYFSNSVNHVNLYTPHIPFPTAFVPSSPAFVLPTKLSGETGQNFIIVPSMNPTPHVPPPQSSAQPTQSTPQTADIPVSTSSAVPDKPRRRRERRVILTPAPPPPLPQPAYQKIFNSKHPDCVEVPGRRRNEKKTVPQSRGISKASKNSKASAAGGNAEASRSSNKRKRNEQDNEGKASEEIPAALKTSRLPYVYPKVSSQTSQAVSTRTTGETYDYPGAASGSFVPYALPLSQEWDQLQVQSGTQTSYNPAPPLDHYYIPGASSSSFDMSAPISSADFVRLMSLPDEEFMAVVNSNPGILGPSAFHGNDTAGGFGSNLSSFNFTAVVPNDANTPDSDSDANSTQSLKLSHEPATGYRGLARRKSLTDLNVCH